MSPPPTLVVLPTYNELPNLTAIVAAVRRRSFDVLVVDDASPDGTGALADSLAAADGGVRVIHRPGKLGLGSAYVEGFGDGLARGYGYLVEMDADGSHPAEHLDALVEAAAATGGLAIGSRYVAGGAITGWNARRRFLSRSANLYCRALLGSSVHDYTSGYRCYPKALVEKLEIGSVVSDGYGFQIEMAQRCIRLGAPVVEVPIRFEDRLAGASKVSSAEIRNAMTLVPRLRWGRGPRRAGAQGSAGFLRRGPRPSGD